VISRLFRRLESPRHPSFGLFAGGTPALLYPTLAFV